jgi:lipoprotein-anchoring transpeptidase ErfK/SrfK
MTLVIMLTALALTTQSRPADTHTAARNTDAFALQVALDRAGFSPGVIDGKMGASTRRALSAYRQRNGRDPEPPADAFQRYQITAEDAAGPFAKRIPQDLEQQAMLPALSYQSVAEALAERFHTTPDVLKTHNPQAAFAAGETIAVPAVKPMVRPAAQRPAEGGATGTTGRAGASRASSNPDASQKPDVVVRVSRSAGALTVRDATDRIVFFAPVTTGTAHDPLPLGEWKVNAVRYNPTFQYNPDLFWDADPSHSKATIKAGPNNPVGLVWIDISKEHYGLHGSPEPAAIGRTQSHGCVRLTNWDAIALADLVKPGTRVIFER